MPCFIKIETMPVLSFLGFNVRVIKDHQDDFLISNRNASADEAKFSKNLPDCKQ